MTDRRGVGRRLGRIDPEPEQYDKLHELERILTDKRTLKAFGAAFSSPLNGPNYGQPIPHEPDEGSARIPFSGYPLDAGQGYAEGGSNRPQSGSGQGAPDTAVTGSQTGTDSAGSTPDLDYLRIQASSDEVDEWDRAYAAGQLLAYLRDPDGAEDDKQADAYIQQHGSDLDATERDILRRCFLMGFTGLAGTEQG